MAMPIGRYCVVQTELFSLFIYYVAFFFFFLHSKHGCKYFRNTLFNLCDNSAFIHKVVNSFIQDLLMEVGENIRKRYI